MNKHSRFKKIRQNYYPFLWFIAAADDDKISVCPVAEQDKQAGIGMAIVCTSVTAVLSGYFAFYSFISYWYISLPLAFLWGIIILNLDRIMVSTMKKDPNGNRWKELLTATPRVLLAILIAVLITKPIEVKFFKNQIDTKKNSVIEADVNNELRFQEGRVNAAEKNRNEDKKEQQDIENKANDCANDPGWVKADENYKTNKAEYDEIEGRANNKITTLRSLYSNARYYSVSESGQRRLTDAGKRLRTALNTEIAAFRVQQKELNCGDLKKLADSLCGNYRIQQASNLQLINNRLTAQDSSIFTDTYINKHQRDSLKAIMQDRYSDVFGQLRILRVIKENDKAMNMASLLIMFLFFAVETAPIFVKIIASRGEYDGLLYVAEKKALDRERSEINTSENELRVQIAASGQNSDALLQKEREMNEMIMNEALEAGANIGKKIIKKWEERESKKMDDNPDDYLDKTLG